MKITAPNIPPELARAFARLIKTRPGSAPNKRIATPKKAASRPRDPKPPREQIKAFTRAVEALARYITQSTGTDPGRTFRAVRLRELRAGFMNTDYWAQCDITADQNLHTSPTSAPYTGARAYAYPDANNKPTTPTYGNGTPTGAMLQYEGTTTGDYYHDDILIWKRMTFELRNPITYGDDEPLLLMMTATIDAATDTRPARCALSVILQYWLRATTTSKAATTEPPTNKPRSIYYRYRRPLTAPPYWTTHYDMRALLSLRTQSREDNQHEMTEATILIAPMPALGKHYNNNTRISTHMETAPTLWQIKKEQPILTYVYYIAAVTVINGQLYATDYLQGPQYHEGDDMQTALSQYAGAVAAAAHAAGVYNQFTWGPDRYYPITPHSAAYYQQINNAYDIADAYINY